MAQPKTDEQWRQLHEQLCDWGLAERRPYGLYAITCAGGEAGAALLYMIQEYARINGLPWNEPDDVGAAFVDAEEHLQVWDYANQIIDDAFRDSTLEDDGG